MSISEITTTAINTNDNKVDEKTAVETEKAVIETPATTSPAPELKPATPKTKRKASTETSSIRVSIDKVDELINMVGELVITQSMLSQLGEEDKFGEAEIEKVNQGDLSRKTLLYFDLMSWIDSKIQGRSFADMVKEKRLISMK